VSERQNIPGSRYTRFMHWLLFTVMVSVAMSCSNSFTDSRDGKIYKTIKIGDQVWMAENLNYDAGEGSYCYKDDSANCEKNGRLYTWDAAGKAAPPGWHLPSDMDWEKLISSFGGIDSIAYSQMIQGGGSGFNALPGIGSRDESGNYLDIGKGAYFWSSTEDGDKDALFCVISKFRQKVHLVSRNKKDGFPVRCIKD